MCNMRTRTEILNLCIEVLGQYYCILVTLVFDNLPVQLQDFQEIQSGHETGKVLIETVL